MKNLILTLAISTMIFVFGGCQSVGLSTDSNSPKEVDSLVQTAVADKGAWEGKEVSVIGYALATSKSGKTYTITVSQEKDSPSGRYVICVGRGSVPEDVKSRSEKGIFKGTIKEVEGDNRVHLKDCEIKS